MTKDFKLGKIFKEIGGFVDSNAPTLATFGSIIGVVATIYFMHKAAPQAVTAKDCYEQEIQDVVESNKCTEAMDEEELKQVKNRIKFKHGIDLVYIYRWALLSGIGSAGFAVLSNYLNGRTIAVLGTLLATNTDKLQKYADKAKEMIGEEKFKELQDSVERDILKDKMWKGDAKPEKTKKIKDDDTPFEDYIDVYVPCIGDRYQGPRWVFDDAMKYFNEMFEKDKTAYLDYNTWRAKIRIPSAPIWRDFCWCSKNPFKAEWGYVDYDGTRGMDAIIFKHMPMIEKSVTK